MIDATVSHFLAKAKAYAALVGSLLVVLVTVVPAEQLPTWVPLVLALLTGFATWAIPNTPTVLPAPDGGPQDIVK